MFIRTYNHHLRGPSSRPLSPSNPDPYKQTVYSLTNYHGDTAMTAAADGTPSSSVYLYEPFGSPSASATFATNSNPTNATDTSMGWAANPTRKVEGAFTIAVIQMGARIYIPTLGRFLQTDPIPGGNANAYVYVVDPVNGNDYSGESGLFDQVSKAFNAAVSYVQYAAGLGRVGYVKQTKLKDYSFNPRTVAQNLARQTKEAKKVKSGTFYGGDTKTMCYAPLKAIVSPDNVFDNLAVGHATLLMTGKLTINGNKWSFKGRVIAGYDYYDFDFNHPVLSKAFADSAIGSAGGIFTGNYGYYNIFPGEMDIDESGTF